MLGRAVNLYFITKYKNISTRKPKYCRAAMRIKEFILYGLTRQQLRRTAYCVSEFSTLRPVSYVEFNSDEFISCLAIMDYPEVKTTRSEREKQTLT